MDFASVSPDGRIFPDFSTSDKQQGNEPNRSWNEVGVLVAALRIYIKLASFAPVYLYCRLGKLQAMHIEDQVEAAPAEVVRLAHFHIQPSRGWLALKLHELWEYRELLYFLVWRDIKVRYKQTVLGGAWAIIQPLMTMLLFSVFFGRLAKVPSDGLPYPLFAFSGLVPWTFFSSGFSRGSDSLVGNSSLIKKVYFPRLAMPIAKVTGGLVDLVLPFILLLGMEAYYGILPGWKTLWLPFFVLLAAAAALGVSFWLSALNVMFRDVGFITPFLAQLWLFATPIAYPSSLLPERWRTIYGINPMVGVVEGFRWALLGARNDLAPVLATSTAVALVMLMSGAFYFRRMERTFADVL
jgi:lipopolysaccharide transport system permease protein